MQAYRKGAFCTLKGCASREQFWGFLLAHALLQMMIYVVFLLGASVWAEQVVYAMMGGEVGIVGTLAAILVACYAVFMVVSIIPAACLTVRRYHDAGLSGWWVLAVLVTLVICAVLTIAAVGYMSSPAREESSLTLLVIPVVIAQLAGMANLVVLASPPGYFGERREPKSETKCCV